MAHPRLRAFVIRLIVLLFALVLFRQEGLHAQDKVPCSTLGVTKPKLCVLVDVADGYLHVLAAEIKAPPKFPWGAYPSKEKVESVLESYLETLFKKQRLYEMDLPMPASGVPSTDVPEAVKTLSKPSLCDAVQTLKMIWPGGHELNLFVSNALPRRLGELKLNDETPLAGASSKGSCEAPKNLGLLSFDIDPPIENIGALNSDATNKVEVHFDRGGQALDSDGLLLKEADVRKWLRDNYEGRFWIGTDIRTHFEHLYQASSLNPTVIVSLSAAKKKFITISESSRIGRILFPAGADGLSPDSNTTKAAYMLLNEQQWKSFKSRRDDSTLLSAVTGGLYALCLPKLKGEQCSISSGDLPNGDVQQRALAYLSTAWLADRSADLQGLGYAVNTQNELPAADTPANRISAIDLVLQKIAPSAKESTPAPADSPQANLAGNSTPDTDVAKETLQTSSSELPAPKGSARVDSRALKPGRTGRLTEAVPSQLAASGQRVVPASAGSSPRSSTSGGKMEYAAGVEYRSNQGFRLLGNVESIERTLGPSALSLSGQIGTDGTHPFGNGNLNLDWLWFEKLGRRLSFQLTGSTDATAKRILGGVELDERRTGGNAQARLQIFRDYGGFDWSVTAEPRRASVALTQSGNDVGKLNLTTIKIGAPLVYQSWIADHPSRVMLDTEVRAGTTGLIGASPYAVITVDGGIHRQISDALLMSIDVSAHFQRATARTPIVEIPSLGGSETLRGFRTDDVLGRRLWSIQNEFWTAVPGTPYAKDGIKGFIGKNIRLATFVDIGGATDTDLTNSPGLTVATKPSAEGIRKAPGLGVRFIQGLMALKFDWAYGFGQGAFGPGRSRFTISLSKNGAF